MILPKLKPLQLTYSPIQQEAGQIYSTVSYTSIAN